MADLEPWHESFAAFCARVEVPLYEHQLADFGEAGRREDGRFVYRLAGVSWPRGDGKSYASAAFALWRLIVGGRGTEILSVALDLDGAQVVLDHARQILRRRPWAENIITIRANALVCEQTDSRWTIASREHTASRGKHPDLVLYDECGWARDDELFASLLAGQASVRDPLFVVTSTVGRRKTGPLWTVKRLAEGGDEAVLWRWHGENRSPRVTAEFLSRQRRILLPGQFAREHQNQWVDGADALTNSADVDAAMSADPIEAPDHATAVGFVDLGVVHDASVIAVGFKAAGRLVIAELLTFQGSHESPVQLAEVERTILRLATRWNFSKIRIESWQGVSAAQSLQAIGLPVELFAPTAKAHSEEWPLLANALAARCLVLPPHARLREELLNLVVEVGPSGVRVIDRGKVHQDHAVAVRGVVAMLAEHALVLSPREIEHLWQINDDSAGLADYDLEKAPRKFSRINL